MGNLALVNPFLKTVVVVGPARTGKKRTLIHHLSAMCNHTEIYKNLLIAEQARSECATAVQSNVRPERSVLRRMHSPRKDFLFLILCATNAALDVVEERIQGGLCVLQEDETNYTMVYPLITRFANDRIDTP